MPIANITDFSATPLSGEGPLTVSFTDLSSPTPPSWLWDFGDGNTSTDQNPTHVYTIPGLYSVTLTPDYQSSPYSTFSPYTRTDYITVTSNPGAYVVKAQSGNIKFLSTDPGVDVNVNVAGSITVATRLSVGDNGISPGSITSLGDLSLTPAGRLSLAGVYWPDGSVEPVPGMYVGVSATNELEFYVLPDANSPLTVKNQNIDYTLQLEDAVNTLIRMTNSVPAQVIMPNDTTANLPIGAAVLISWSGTGSVSIAGEAGVIVDTPETLEIGKQYGKITAIKVAANRWEIEGNLAPIL